MGILCRAAWREQLSMGLSTNSPAVQTVQFPSGTAVLPGTVHPTSG